MMLILAFFLLAYLFLTACKREVKVYSFHKHTVLQLI